MVKRRVAHPGVAVVPVAAAADGLGQRRRRRRADRAGRLERQRLEHAAAVVDEVAPRSVVGLVQLRPRLPGRDGVVEPVARSRPGSSTRATPRVGARAVVERERRGSARRTTSRGRGRSSRRRRSAAGTTARARRRRRPRARRPRPPTATDRSGRTRVGARTRPRSRPRPRCTSRGAAGGAATSLPELVPAVALAHRQRVDDA